VYGVHMFAGCNTYAVMKRVLGGVHSGNIPFPNVNLGPESDALDRVKDFICRLCRINPTERLGVHPVTGQFDEEAIRGHPFFGDFSWSLLDEQVQHYRAPVVLTTPSDSGSVRTPAVQGPLHPQLLDDGTASLKSRYHVLPVHSREYAEYVFEATADANPFERWMQTKVEDPTGVSDQETTKHNASFVEDMPIATPVNDGDVEEENSDEYSDVIDDVGMQFFGVVHPDFLDIA
ncbi:protein kinase, partial [Trypanosoma cruzi]